MNEDGVIYLILIFGLFLNLGLGAIIGQRKGRTGMGLLLGFLLGPIGWILIALGPNMKPKCSQCGGVLADGAKKCMHCGTCVVIDQRGQKNTKAANSSQGSYSNIRLTPVKEQTIGCPNCNAPIPASRIKNGRNVCPSCVEAFDAEL